jgi:hypothetical protein
MCPGKTQCGASCVDVTGDPDNCGACGHGCQGGACTAGLCQPITLATASGWVLSLATDGTYLAYGVGGPAAQGGGAFSIRTSGVAQTPVVVASSPDTFDGVRFVAFAGGKIYWTQYTSVSGIASLDMGTPGVADSGSGACSGWTQAFPDGFLGMGLAATPARDRVVYIGWDPSTEQLAAGYTGGDAGGCNPGFSQGEVQNGPGGIATDGVSAFWTADDFVLANPIGATGPFSLVASGQADPLQIVYVSGYLYWFNSSYPAYYRVPYPGSSAAPTLILDNHEHASPTGFAANAKYIFYTDDEPVVHYTPVDGSGAPSTLATGTKPGALTIDGTSLYWVDGTDNTLIRKVALPL